MISLKCVEQLGGPLLRCAHAIVLTRAPAAPSFAGTGGSSGGRKGVKKGARGGLHAVAVAAVTALLGLCPSAEALTAALGGPAPSRPVAAHAAGALPRVCTVTGMPRELLGHSAEALMAALSGSALSCGRACCRRAAEGLHSEKHGQGVLHGVVGSRGLFPALCPSRET